MRSTGMKIPLCADPLSPRPFSSTPPPPPSSLPPAPSLRVFPPPFPFETDRQTHPLHFSHILCPLFPPLSFCYTEPHLTCHVTLAPAAPLPPPTLDPQLLHVAAAAPGHLQCSGGAESVPHSKQPRDRRSARRTAPKAGGNKRKNDQRNEFAGLADL